MPANRLFIKTATWMVALISALIAVLAIGASAALAAAPWWHLSATTRPTVLQPEGEGQLILTAANLGDATANGALSPIVISDTVPSGLNVLSNKKGEPEIEAVAGSEDAQGRGPVACSLPSAHLVECTFAGTGKNERGEVVPETLPPYDLIEVRIGVRVQPGASAGEQNAIGVSGGGARSASLARPLRVGEEPTPFGVDDYELLPEEQGGALATQAGRHPFQLTTVLTLNQGEAKRNSSGEYSVSLPALSKDLHFKWPPGLIGNPTPFAHCSLSQFLTLTEGNANNECPSQSVVGVALVTADFPPGSGLAGTQTFTQAVYNLEPQAGEPARFGWEVNGIVPVIIDTSVRTGSDYGITVSAPNITQEVSFLSNEVTIWGVPGDPAHDGSRGSTCIREARGESHVAPCVHSEQLKPPAFLSMPTSCTGPLSTSGEADSWANQGHFEPFAGEGMQAMDGCNRLPFSPSFTVVPDGRAGSSATGLTTDVHVPQEGSLTPEGLAEGQVRDITVALPQGLQLNPSDADGLQACSESQIGFTGVNATTGADEFTPAEASCPDASKVGTATITTPVLPNPIKGFVYLAAPQNFQGFPQQNPFESLVAMYLVARDPVSGVLVKLPGSVSLSESGQITATFKNTPQAPFEDASLEFFGGERAPLATPARCGSYTATASFAPWSGSAPVASTAPPFEISSGPATTASPGGTPCPGASLPFSPSLSAGSPNVSAGAFSPLNTTISREDGQQSIQQVTLHMAPGMSGILAGVPLCPEAQANAGTCPESSRIGETIVSVGLGGDPFTVTGGKVYLTEHYAGAPFGLSIVNPAKAGPFNLQEGNPVVVRAKIEIDPTTAALTITTGQIPQIIDGFPLQIKHVNVTVNRPGFTFNPTNCNKMEITGAIGAWEGATAPVSTPFQVTNCAALKYTPTLTVSTAAKASRANGASLFFKIAYPKGAIGSQSWMKLMKFNIPRQLPSRLTTLQKACIAATFEHDRAACPPASIIGHVLVHTPVVPVPLEGPLYFVSYGGAAFPDAVAVIQGEGITIESHGHTFIGGGVTSATFESVPDVPFESIEVTVPQGPFSEFGSNLPASAHGSFCGQKLAMPVVFQAQNGQEIRSNVPVGVTGCAKAKTRAQLLAAALKACKKDKNKAKRQKCEKAAHKAYGARVSKSSKKKR